VIALRPVLQLGQVSCLPKWRLPTCAYRYEILPSVGGSNTKMKRDVGYAKQTHTPIAGGSNGFLDGKRIRADARNEYADAKRTKTADAGRTKKQEELDQNYKAASKKIPDQGPGDPWAGVRPSPTAKGQSKNESLTPYHRDSFNKQTPQ
jgi:hypothetical protein